MALHELSKSSYEATQTGILSSDIFLSVEGKPLNVRQAPLEVHNHAAVPVPLEVANIPFIGIKNPDEDTTMSVVVRNKNNRIMNALRLVFSNLPSNVVEYRYKDQTSPSHKREDTFSY